ncbi:MULTISPECIES: MerR family transcriptional regulator [unclassified Nocardioides]|uniref:MerR family transcriptional regulator n=1 Tax=unclassified Nocardioides TaxID=2615069 RepID=UPI003606817D
MAGRSIERRVRIGAFADAAGVSVDAVRFYERRGLLRTAPRTGGGYRTFDQHDLDRVLLARQLQTLGLTVDEVVDALAVHAGRDASCASQRWRLEAVEARVEQRMAELRRTRRLIRETLAACDSGDCLLAADGDGLG